MWLIRSSDPSILLSILLTLCDTYWHILIMNVKMENIIFLFLLPFVFCRSNNQNNSVKCVLGWCLPKDYQKLESPRPDSPVNVDINVEILDILSVNDKEFSISMSMYFSVMWQESRIVTNNTIESGFWYPVSLEFLNDLWIPNVFIYNLKSFSSLQVLKRLAGECQSDSDCNYWILSWKIWN